MELIIRLHNFRKTKAYKLFRGSLESKQDSRWPAVDGLILYSGSTELHTLSFTHSKLYNWQDSTMQLLIRNKITVTAEDHGFIYFYYMHTISGPRHNTSSPPTGRWTFEVVETRHEKRVRSILKASNDWTERRSQQFVVILSSRRKVITCLTGAQPEEEYNHDLVAVVTWLAQVNSLYTPLLTVQIHSSNTHTAESARALGWSPVRSSPGSHCSDLWLVPLTAHQRDYLDFV